MKKGNNIRLIYKIKVFLLVTLTMMGLLCNSNIRYTEYAVSTGSETEQEPLTEQQKEHTAYVMAYEAIVPAFSINVDIDFYTILEAPLLNIIRFVEIPREIIAPSKFFNTLFRVIISPNAP